MPLHLSPVLVLLQVLTTRVAHLHLALDIPAENIVVVTFTRKAAKEMTHRLDTLLGPQATSRLQLGTFHSLCARYLRDHGELIGLPRHFTILDPEDCRAICASIIKSQLPSLNAMSYDIKDTSLREKISGAKSKGETYHDVERAAVEMFGKAQAAMKKTAQLFKEYERELKKRHAIDFDDMIIYGRDLIKNHPEILNVDHVLVDEFQDTNRTQYELVQLLAKRCNGLSIVGDPDQAIYGWRAAEVANLQKMKKDFRGCQTILLEDNYRSTGGILAASHVVVDQDKNRVAKGLRSNHPAGHLPIVMTKRDAHDQAQWIASEIHRVRNATGLSFSDFAVLLRYNSLSRPLEQAFHAARVPNRLVGTTGFFMRKEVKDVLAYLSLLDNPYNTVAFERVVNVPNRGLGAKTVETLSDVADREGCTALEVASRAARGENIAGVTKPLATKLKGFVYILDTLRDMAYNGEGPHALLQKMLFLTAYKEYLTRTADDPTGRWENVKELLSFALEEERRMSGEDAAAAAPVAESPVFSFEDQNKDFELLPIAHTQGAAARLDNLSSNPLRNVLEACSLSTDTAEGSPKYGAVSIATIHSAKGLEMPVVFLPGLNDDVLPFFKAKNPGELAEERRLLFVAMTRAQTLLYMSSTQNQMAGRGGPATRCRFLTDALRSHNNKFAIDRVPEINEAARAEIFRVIGRDMISLPEALSGSQSRSFASLTDISLSSSQPHPSATPRASTSSSSMSNAYATPSLALPSSSQTKDDRLALAAQAKAKFLAARSSSQPSSSQPSAPSTPAVAPAPPVLKAKSPPFLKTGGAASHGKPEGSASPKKAKGKGKAIDLDGSSDMDGIVATDKDGVINLDSDDPPADVDETPIAREKQQPKEKKGKGTAPKKRAAEEDALIVIDVDGAVKGGKTLRSSKRVKK